MKRPDYTNPWEAARVRDFIEERRVGRWQTVHFEKTVEEYEKQQTTLPLVHAHEPEKLNLEMRRLVTPGEYVSLWRKRIPAELETVRKDEVGLPADIWQDYIDSRPDSDPVLWAPIMSDTPAEISEHRHAIENATGRVLIHGLGLGVLVSALLAKPDVKHIDVVEIDREVIALTGGYYSSDPRVRIWRGDAVEKRWPAHKRWDYVWHDIWSHISSRNLTDDEAEHGISYDRIFKLFEGRADLQGAWAYEEALEMHEIYEEGRAADDEWNERFFTGDTETKVAMLLEYTVREQCHIPPDQEVPQYLIDFLDAHFDYSSKFRETVTAPDFSREHWEEWARQPQPLGRPNEV